MPFPWYEDDPQVRSRIHANLAALLPDIVASGHRRDPVALDLVRGWHQRMVDGIALAAPEVAGGFRGSGPQGGRLRTYRVTVDGILQAVPPRQVRSKMSIFERRLREQVAALDPFIPAKAPPDQRDEQVLELCGWAHGELIYVHPFADGNGRMARALLLWLGARYGLPVFLDLRPRPERSIRVRGRRESLDDWAAPAHAGHPHEDARRLPHHAADRRPMMVLDASIGATNSVSCDLAAA